MEGMLVASMEFKWIWEHTEETFRDMVCDLVQRAKRGKFGAKEDKPYFLVDWIKLPNVTTTIYVYGDEVVRYCTPGNDGVANAFIVAGFETLTNQRFARQGWALSTFGHHHLSGDELDDDNMVMFTIDMGQYHSIPFDKRYLPQGIVDRFKQAAILVRELSRIRVSRGEKIDECDGIFPIMTHSYGDRCSLSFMDGFMLLENGRTYMSKKGMDDV